MRGFGEFRGVVTRLIWDRLGFPTVGCPIRFPASSTTRRIPGLFGPAGRYCSGGFAAEWCGA